MICWILSRPVANVLPLAAALKLVGAGGWAIFRLQIINSYFVCVAVCYRKTLVGIMNRPVEVNRKMDSACVGAKIRGIESDWNGSRQETVIKAVTIWQGSVKWSQLQRIQGSSPSSKGQLRLTDTGSSRHLPARKDQQEGNATGSIQDHQKWLPLMEICNSSLNVKASLEGI